MLVQSRQLLTTLGVVLAMTGLGGCGSDDTAAITSSDREIDSEQPTESTHFEEAAESFGDLKPPSMALPNEAAPILGDAVSFVPCDEANRYVAGVLQASEVLVAPTSERVCYIEHITEDSRRYAGALIVPAGYDASRATIIEVIETGGTAVTVTAGLESVQTFPGTNPDAPSGGFAAFELDPGTAGHVVRLRTNRTQAMFHVQNSAGETVRIEVTDSGSPDTVVAKAQQVFAAIDANTR